MTLLVHTARLNYRGADRFDITRKSGGKAGHVFAPSWRILGPALEARKEAKRVLENAEENAAYLEGTRVLRHGSTEARVEVPNPEGAARVRRNAKNAAAKIERDAYSDYVPAFLAEMEESRRRHPEAWMSLLARERVVLVCYCKDAERCHRRIVAELLASLGATDAGEIVQLEAQGKLVLE